MKKKSFGILRFAGMAAAVMLLTGLLVKGCNYLLTDDTQSYTRLTMHELYETAGREKEIDSLFLGSSHCFRAYDPMQFEELTGKNAFNLGSSAQNYDTSYYLLKEALRLCDIRTVYLDMHYKFLFIDKEDKILVQANIISDYMRFSPNKLEFLLTTSEAKEYTNRFFPFRRNWQELGDWEYLRGVWEKKGTDAYKSYAPVRQEQEYYAGRGFVWSDEELDAQAITWWDNFTPVSEDMQSEVTYTLEYIEKIVRLCEKEGIRLVFVTAPSFDRYLEAVGPYGEAHEYIQNMADGFGVPYLDFNLCRNEYLALGEDNYLDVDHLNGKGAEQLTQLLAEISQKAEDKASWQELIDEYFNAWYD